VTDDNVITITLLPSGIFEIVRNEIDPETGLRVVRHLTTSQHEAEAKGVEYFPFMQLPAYTRHLRIKVENTPGADGDVDLPGDGRVIMTFTFPQAINPWSNIV